MIFGRFLLAFTETKKSCLTIFTGFSAHSLGRFCMISAQVNLAGQLPFEELAR